MSRIEERRAAAAAKSDENPAYRERVRTIRQAAARVFHDRGYHATSIGDVADQAGMDRASLYYYVGSKEQLFHDVVTEAVTDNVDAAERIAAGDLPADEKLRRLIEEVMVSFHDSYPFMYVFLQEDVEKLDAPGSADDDWLDRVNDWTTRFFVAVRSIVEEGIGDGSLQTTLTPGAVANCIIGVLASSRRWYRPEGAMGATQMADGIARLVLRGVSTGD